MLNNLVLLLFRCRLLFAFSKSCVDLYIRSRVAGRRRTKLSTQILRAMIKRSKHIFAVIHRRSFIPVGIIVTINVAQVQIAQNGVNSAHVLDGLFNLFEGSVGWRSPRLGGSDGLRQVFGHERIRSNSRATSRWRERVASKLSPIVATRNFAKFIHVRLKILQIIIPVVRIDELVFDVLRALGEIIRSDRFRHAVKISRFLNSRIVVDGIHQPIPTNL